MVQRPRVAGLPVVFEFHADEFAHYPYVERMVGCREE
jgi:hypothetical protein